MSPPTHRRCNRCQETKALDEFYRDKNQIGGRGYRCKVCSRRYSVERYKYREDTDSTAHRRRRANNKLRANFGITIDDYNALLEYQGGGCAVCGKAETVTNHVTGEPRALAVDHDHNTGEIRGLLCCNHNRALGLLGDDVASLVNLLGYLLDPPAQRGSGSEGPSGQVPQSAGADLPVGNGGYGSQPVPA